MFRRSALPFFLGITLFAAGCNSTPQTQTQTQTKPSTGSPARQPEAGAYNRTYQDETHHRHHHHRRDEAPNDNWTSYDRSEPADEAANSGDSGAFSPRANESQNRPRHHNSRALSATPGQFDFYVLNLSWSPEFCAGHPSAPECAQHRAFTLHGLWPQNNDGTYPEDCSEAPGPADPSQYSDIYPDPTLLQHEWQTHGTCSGLAPDPFFALARRADQSVGIPVDLTGLTQTTTSTPAQLTALFTRSNPNLPATSIAISCGNNVLTAVEVCLDKNLQPASCSSLKSCRANQIRIPAPR